MNAKYMEHKNISNGQPFMVVSHTEAEREDFARVAEIIFTNYGWDLFDTPISFELGDGDDKIITHWIPMSDDPEEVDCFNSAWEAGQALARQEEE